MCAKATLLLKTARKQVEEAVFWLNHKLVKLMIAVEKSLIQEIFPLLIRVFMSVFAVLHNQIGRI